MAVQKSRVTPSRRGQRRSHDALSAPQLATDPRFATNTDRMRNNDAIDSGSRNPRPISTSVPTIARTI